MPAPPRAGGVAPLGRWELLAGVGVRPRLPRNLRERRRSLLLPAVPPTAGDHLRSRGSEAKLRRRDPHFWSRTNSSPREPGPCPESTDCHCAHPGEACRRRRREPSPPPRQVSEALARASAEAGCRLRGRAPDLLVRRASARTTAETPGAQSVYWAAVLRPTALPAPSERAQSDRRSSGSPNPHRSGLPRRAPDTAGRLRMLRASE